MAIDSTAKKQRRPTLSLLWAYPAGSKPGLPPALTAHLAPLEKAEFQVFLLALDPLLADSFLEQQFIQAISDSAFTHLPWVIGGYSLGARIAVRVSQKTSAQALVCFAYPFHRRGKPKQTHGLSDLLQIKKPCLIVQGTRDSHGNREMLRGHAPLPKHVQIHWVEDANHQLLPRSKSGHNSADLWRDSSHQVIDFLQQLCYLGSDE